MYCHFFIIVCTLNTFFLHAISQNDTIAVNSTLLTNRVERYRHLNTSKVLDIEPKISPYAFIAITSSPKHPHLRHAARETWLLPCKVSKVCDYRFFIDLAPSIINKAIMAEEATYLDIVLRRECKLMGRHPDSVNYGNSPPVEAQILNPEKLEAMEEAVAKKLMDNESIERGEIPDYKYRRVYKIDWKVCFLQWALDHKRLTDYIIFVEDDSFICTENLLYQIEILRNHFEFQSKTDGFLKSNHAMITGTFMYDGFDDSSTFMSRSVAMAFARDYGRQSNDTYPMGFECDLAIWAFEQNNSKLLNELMWQSWGNSWMSIHCNWRDVLRKRGIYIDKPDTNCLHSRFYHKNMTEMFIQSPCMDKPLIFHHSQAGEILLKGHKYKEEDVSAKKGHIYHVCEHMLLIDKVKDPSVTFKLWNAAQGNEYLNLSAVFLFNNTEGWDVVIEDFLKRSNHLAAAEGQPGRRLLNLTLMEDSAIPSSIQNSPRYHQSHSSTWDPSSTSTLPHSAEIAYFFHSMFQA